MPLLQRQPVFHLLVFFDLDVSMFVLNLDIEWKVMCNIHQVILCVVSMVTALSVKCKCLLVSVWRSHHEI